MYSIQKTMKDLQLKHPSLYVNKHSFKVLKTILVHRVRTCLKHCLLRDVRYERLDIAIAEISIQLPSISCQLISNSGGCELLINILIAVNNA